MRIIRLSDRIPFQGGGCGVGAKTEYAACGEPQCSDLKCGPWTLVHQIYSWVCIVRNRCSGPFALAAVGCRSACIVRLSAFGCHIGLSARIGRTARHSVGCYNITTSPAAGPAGRFFARSLLPPFPGSIFISILPAVSRLAVSRLAVSRLAVLVLSSLPLPLPLPHPLPLPLPLPLPPFVISLFSFSLSVILRSAATKNLFQSRHSKKPGPLHLCSPTPHLSFPRCPAGGGRAKREPGNEKTFYHLPANSEEHSDEKSVSLSCHCEGRRPVAIQTHVVTYPPLAMQAAK